MKTQVWWHEAMVKQRLVDDQEQKEAVSGLRVRRLRPRGQFEGQGELPHQCMAGFRVQTMTVARGQEFGWTFLSKTSFESLLPFLK